MQLVLVVDMGTTNMKAGIVDERGQVLSHCSEEVEIHRPERGAAEHDPRELLQGFKRIVSKASQGYEEEIDVLALSGYQFGFLPLNGEMEPLSGMMTLLDERPKVVMEDFQREAPLEEIYRKTGCPPLFTYNLVTLRWLKRERPDLFAASKYFAGIKSYLIHWLTGRFCTEPSISSATQLLNIHQLDWDEEILDLAGIDSDQLPRVVSGADFLGEIPRSKAKQLGLGPGVRLLPGIYDGGAMILGMGGQEGAYGVCNLGTTAMLRGSFSQPLLDDPARRRLQCYSLIPGKWTAGGAVNNAGVALKWIRDQLWPGADYGEIVEAASKVEAGSEGLFCLPYLTGERDPRIGNMASGSFFGLKEYHSRAHLARAVMEGVCYSLNLVKEALAENGWEVEGLRVGGSGSKSDLWPQILANVLEGTVEKSLTEDATLIGEAILAYQSLGLYSDLEEAVDSLVKTGAKFEPEEEKESAYREGYRFFRDLLAQSRELYDDHARSFSG